MKLRNIKIFTMGLIMASLAFAQFGCEDDWQKDNKPSKLQAPSTGTVAVNTIKDSTAMLDYSLSTVGRLFIVVTPGTDETTTPSAGSLLKLNTTGKVFTKQVVFNDAASLSGSVKITGLVQNTSYKVFALPVNTDGVQGEIATTDAFITGDTHVPVLTLASGVSPAISSSAAQEPNFTVKLTFDEPVELAETFTIQMGYRNAVTAEITYIDVPSENISISSKVVNITQPSTSIINGQYVFLTIGANSINDRSGNAYAGVTSGVVGGSLTGIYWRVKFAPTFCDILPEEDITSDVAMKITLDFPIKMRFPTAGEGGYIQSNVVVHYTSPGTTIDVEVPQANVAVVNDTLVSLTLPRTPIYGETVTFKMSEGAMRNSYGNPSASIVFGDKDWFFSYGYARTLVLGNYTIGGLVSYWDGPLADEYPVTLAAHPTDASKVLIQGFMGSEDEIEAVFDGDFATLTIYPDGASGQMLTFPAGHAYEAYEFEFWNPISTDDGTIIGTISSDGTITFENLGLYYYAVDGSDDGWFDIYTESIWTNDGSKVSKQTIYKSVVSKAKDKKLNK